MTTPSPLLSINSGTAGAAADVAAGSTVNGALANAAGANFWSVAITNTDETNAVATVQATLTVNQLAKTFSFTAPSTLGSAVQITSIVGVAGLGLDANGKVNPAFTTTTKVNVLTSASTRVAHTNETTEQDATFGWDSILNDAARQLGATAGIPLGHTGTTQLTLAQYKLFTIVLTDTGLTGNCQLIFPSTTTQRAYLIDTTGVTFAGHTITVYGVTNGNSPNVAITTQTATLVYVSGTSVVAV
jgi:hypothetical protein